MATVGGTKRPGVPGGGVDAPPRKRPAPDLDDDLIMEEEDFDMEPPEDLEAEEAALEVDAGSLGEAGKNWPRPPPPALNPQTDKLEFQQLEVEYQLAPPHRGLYAPDGLREVPVLKMFGVTRAGNSVCAFVHGFEPYFYVEAPPRFTPDDCATLQWELNSLLVGRDRRKVNSRQVLGVHLEQRQTVMYYQPQRSRPFLRVVLATPDQVAPARSLFEMGVPCPNSAAGVVRGLTYESNVLFPLRFMIDRGIVGGSWVELPAARYQLVPEQARQSHCQLEAHVRYDAVVAHASEGEYAGNAPIRILSVDIECQGRKGHFPEAEVDPVIQIASLVSVLGQPQPAVRNIMTLKSCAPIAGAEVMSFEDERALLLRWRDLLLETDPDIIIGYNIVNFDLPYLINRAETLKLPAFKTWGRMRNKEGRVKGGDPTEGVAYEGATVLEPKAGYYPRPVATLDFASLYPSVMMAHNLCYTTLLPKGAPLPPGLPPSGVTTSPSGDRFVKPAHTPGLLPEILQELLAARKRAKKDMEAAADPFLRAVFNGRQLALKVSANSVYGFTGATVGALPCLEISSSVTSFGREMIDTTKRLVMERYCRANGYPADADVVYGDTDSVSKAFISPIRLEFEKVYSPYLLISKKRYAGLLWTRPDRWDKIDTKGIETVRRDNCLLVRNVVTTCLEKILVGRDPDAAAAYVKGVISDLLMNKLDLSLLVISKGLTQDADEYEAKAAHVELAKKMRKRDPATAPAVGDRVPYVIVRAAKGAKAYEKAEDPIYALKNNLPIDCQHYLDHHLAQPLMRLFEPILKNPRELLTGAHTRSILVSTPSAASGGIMRFAQKKLTCLGCKAPLDKGEATVCKHCRRARAGGGRAGGAGKGERGRRRGTRPLPRVGEVYARTVCGVNDLEAQFSALWTQCQRCQGSLHQDVLCRSRDCPIFYRRMKVQKELGEDQAKLARFAEDDW
eukprot:scaffold3.g6196.t1